MNDNILGKRIKILRNESELTQEEFGNKYNLRKSTISQYESGTSRPDDELKTKIATDYNVSIDWLLGLTDIRNPYEDKEKDITLPIAAHFKGKEMTEEQRKRIEKFIEFTLNEDD